METDSEPLKVKLLLAELYDMQGRYKDVERVYREALADKKATEADRAVTKNNLAFILSVVNPTPAAADEALKMAEESIQMLGPRSDLLDTRALAYLAQGKAKQAAADLRMAVADTPSMAKYYHLAQAEKQLGNVDAAREAMGKAEEMRTEQSAFTLIERQGYEKLANELNVQIKTVKTRDSNS
jgi:Tfp pilus assembly protein PilF